MTLALLPRGVSPWEQSPQSPGCGDYRSHLRPDRGAETSSPLHRHPPQPLGDAVGESVMLVLGSHPSSGTGSMGAAPPSALGLWGSQRGGSMGPGAAHHPCLPHCPPASWVGWGRPSWKAGAGHWGWGGLGTPVAHRAPLWPASWSRAVCARERAPSGPRPGV